MAHRRDAQRYRVSDGLVERRIRARSEQVRLVPVLHVVLDVTHLVVDCLEVFRVHLRAHLDPAVQPPPITNGRDSIVLGVGALLCSVFIYLDLHY